MRKNITTNGQRFFGIQTEQVAVDMFCATGLLFTDFVFAALSNLRLNLRAWYERVLHVLALPTAPAIDGASDMLGRGLVTNPLYLSSGKAVPVSRGCLIAG